MSLTAPLVLTPVLVPKPWGGRRLHQLGRHEDGTTPMGESWDVADLPSDATPVANPVSRVATGPHAGRSLGELLGSHGAELLGRAEPSRDGRFPLLVKLLDAREALSVQVHPPRGLDPARYKTESWVVLDAAPDAELLVGVRREVTLSDVRDTIGTKAFVDLLQPVPARAGDVIHVPAGTIHALGAGALVAEVQTPSDVTHRLWDWPDQRDGGRALHLEEGLRAIEDGWSHNLGVTAAPAHDGVLVRTEAYTLARETVAAGDTVAASTVGGTARVAVVLDGEVCWDEGGQRHTRSRSECVLLPAASTVPLTATQDAKVLVATPA